MYNPYKILGVSPTSKKADIKTKYRELSKVYHPDNLVSGDVQKFQQIKKAWEFIDTHHKDGMVNKQWVHKTLFTITREVI